MILLGTGLLMLPLSHAKGEVAPQLVALFTATSAVCVTGSFWSSSGQVIVMALFQIGGFGMMTSATLMGQIGASTCVCAPSAYCRPSRAVGVGGLAGPVSLGLGVQQRRFFHLG